MEEPQTLEALRRSRAEAFKRAKGMTIEKFREAKFEGATDVGWVDPEDDLGDVFLVIDDFNAFAQKYEMVNGLADRVVRLAQSWAAASLVSSCANAASKLAVSLAVRIPEKPTMTTLAAIRKITPSQSLRAMPRF